MLLPPESCKNIFWRFGQFILTRNKLHSVLIETPVSSPPSHFHLFWQVRTQLTNQPAADTQLKKHQLGQLNFGNVIKIRKQGVSSPSCLTALSGSWKRCLASGKAEQNESPSNYHNGHYLSPLLPSPASPADLLERPDPETLSYITVQWR